jgi:arginine/lysine/ornithine decarboxylase
MIVHSHYNKNNDLLLHKVSRNSHQSHQHVLILPGAYRSLIFQTSQKPSLQFD